LDSRRDEAVDWEAVFRGRAPPPDREALLAKMREMRAAARAIPRGYLLSQFGALVLMVLYGLVLVSQIGSPHAPGVFLVVFVTDALLAHYIVVLGRLRRIAEGEK